MRGLIDGVRWLVRCFTLYRAMSGEGWRFEVCLADFARFRQVAVFWQRRDPLQLQLLAFAAIPLGGTVAMVAYGLPPIN